MKKNQIRLGEEGFAPLIISIVLIIVLSLITVGFVNLMANNERNALNRQLSNDAYYAAESGVNYALNEIQQAISNNKPLSSVSHSKCGTPIDVGSNQDTVSCLLINPTPTALTFNQVGLGHSTTVILSSANNQNIASVLISWEPHNSVNNPVPSGWATNCNNNPCFYPLSKWGSHDGIVQISLTPVSEKNNLPTDTSSTLTAYLYPLNSSTGGTMTLDANDIGQYSGAIEDASCNNTICNETINISSSSQHNFQHKNIILNLASIYNKSDITVSAIGSDGSPLALQNSQVLIDSTGDDRGVLKRIQVSVPVSNQNNVPDFSIATTGPLCKNITASPGTASTSGDSACGGL